MFIVFFFILCVAHFYSFQCLITGSDVLQHVHIYQWIHIFLSKIKNLADVKKAKKRKKHKHCACLAATCSNFG